MRSIIGTICCFLIFNCAKVHPRRRIYGGSNAHEGQFPQQVLINHTLLKPPTICGGSILNNITILTAGHCVCGPRFTKEKIVIRVGSNQRISGGNIYQVDKIVCHDKYTYSPLVYDIALVKLKNRIKYSKNIKAIKLPMSYVADNTDLIFAGWGKTNISQFIADDLQHMHLKPVNYRKCEERAGLHNTTIPKNVLCAIGLGPGYGVCYGDSGGPLMDTNGTQYGIASEVIMGCAVGEPDVFTDVFKYKNWIEEKILNL